MNQFAAAAADSHPGSGGGDIRKPVRRAGCDDLIIGQPKFYYGGYRPDGVDRLGRPCRGCRLWCLHAPLRRSAGSVIPLALGNRFIASAVNPKAIRLFVQQHLVDQCRQRRDQGQPVHLAALHQLQPRRRLVSGQFTGHYRQLGGRQRQHLDDPHRRRLRTNISYRQTACQCFLTGFL